MAQRYAFLGEVGSQLRCADVLVLARAYGDLASPQGDGMFAIGHDARASSASLAELVSIGLRSGGHHVTHLDECTTPCLEWSISELNLCGGMMITGGHASPDWNGLRFYHKQAQPMPVAPIAEAASRWSRMEDLLSTECTQTLCRLPMLSDYAASLRQWVRSVALMKLALDAGNGQIGVQVDAILSHLNGIRVWPLGFESDPGFKTSGPNPFGRNKLKRLARVVKDNGCNFGAAIDVSGECLAVVDEQGSSVSPEALGWLLARQQTEVYPDRKILFDPACHPRPSDIETAEAVGGGAFEAWGALHKNAASLYFDDHGHYAFSDIPGTSNALFALMMLIRYIDERGTTLSELLSMSSNR
ncbi:hypothetical protein BI364_10250 [Acidihalobacter yilgarnensis]|uniref:phosphomannomutase n=1 Tax=Acidihalobacter yilgarnensis TaxID=2819280 RepID=A0A1D8IPB6_9GAMM|nr:hypothetical protein BI364_10250 [Acidihalobacter yilgarnensis]